MYRLLGFSNKSQDTLQNAYQKNIIDRQIINYLQTERLIHTKQSNKEHLSLVGEKIQSAINLLQHPANCSNARFLVCPIDDPGWGFGFLTHQIRICLELAMESRRTMILKNEKSLRNFNVKWNDVFEPASNCSYEKHVLPFLPLKEYLKPEQTDRILIFHFGLDLRIRAFDFAPMEIKNLLKYHSNPTLWFHGQLIKYIWRTNARTKNVVNQIVSRIPFECGPVVGIHVRRTDKITEAKFHELDEYMEWVDFWFNVMGEKNNQTARASLNCTNRRMLFIASDVLKDIVKEAKNKWGDKYEVYHGSFNKKSDPRDALAEMLAAFHILAKCQYLVCTFSSNFGRVSFELMQTFQGDASENAHSLDFFFSELWWDNEMEATAEYKPIQEYPNSPIELRAEKGDIIVVKSPITQNGFIRGKNLRSNIEGHFPMYLLKEYLKFENSPTFINLNIPK
ncbi:hypothetical protein ACQ4LE_002527 [Meloidogyne hapla]